MLTQRLTELEARGPRAQDASLPPPASVQVYEATEWGLEAVPIIASLGTLGGAQPVARSDAAG